MKIGILPAQWQHKREVVYPILRQSLRPLGNCFSFAECWRSGRNLDFLSMNLRDPSLGPRVVELSLAWPVGAAVITVT